MANIKISPEAFLDLLQSGKYSDFVLTCNGVEWKLHKAVVCLQSPVIAAALNGPFTEATLGRMPSNPDFDVATMARLVQFLYVGDYSSSPSLAGTWPPIKVLRDELQQHRLREANEPSPRCLEAEISLNIAADYYRIPALSAMTRSRVEGVLKYYWNAAIFPGLLKNAEEKVQDKDLWQIMIDAAVTHIHTLTESKEFHAVELESRTVVQILCSHARMAKEKRKEKRKHDLPEAQMSWSRLCP